MPNFVQLTSSAHKHTHKQTYINFGTTSAPNLWGCTFSTLQISSFVVCQEVFLLLFAVKTIVRSLHFFFVWKLLLSLFLFSYRIPYQILAKVMKIACQWHCIQQINIRFDFKLTHQKQTKEFQARFHAEAWLDQITLLYVRAYREYIRDILLKQFKNVFTMSATPSKWKLFFFLSLSLDLIQTFLV